MELITNMLKGTRVTADVEEEWGDDTEADLSHAMPKARLLHDVKVTSLVADYQAQDLKEETTKWTLKFKKRGNLEHTHFVFKGLQG